MQLVMKWMIRQRSDKLSAKTIRCPEASNPKATQTIPSMTAHWPVTMYGEPRPGWYLEPTRLNIFWNKTPWRAQPIMNPATGTPNSQSSALNALPPAWSVRTILSDRIILWIILDELYNGKCWPHYLSRHFVVKKRHPCLTKRGWRSFIKSRKAKLLMFPNCLASHHGERSVTGCHAGSTTVGPNVCKAWLLVCLCQWINPS